MEKWKTTRNPLPTVDIILRNDHNQIVLIKRRNPPHGWALPGGFVDSGESCEHAAKREAKEELSVSVTLIHQLGTYSDPNRDPRIHTISVVFVAEQNSSDTIQGADDALDAKWFLIDEVPWNDLCFDHDEIIRDYLKWCGVCPTCGKERSG